MDGGKNPVSLLTLFLTFLQLGVIGFGGPAAHLALMESELVQRRQWLTRERFLDIIGVTNLIPGPNSTEVAIHIGHLCRGYRGLVVAGFGFILPATLLSVLFGVAYVRFGYVPEFASALKGIQPVVLVLVAAAVYNLAKAAVPSRSSLLLAGTCLVAVLVGANEIAVLFAGGFAGAAIASSRVLVRGVFILCGIACVAAAWWFATLPLAMPAHSANVAAEAHPGAFVLFGYFLKVGALLYGSGYVLFAFLQGGVVEHFRWLTDVQLLDAIAVGQFTPGPVSSTATFIGYILSGWRGALVATVGMFLPSFAFVALLANILPRLRQIGWTSAFLSAVNAISIALIIAVCIRMAVVIGTAWQAWALALGFAAAMVYLRIPSPVLILFGGVLGVLLF